MDRHIFIVHYAVHILRQVLSVIGLRFLPCTESYILWSELSRRKLSPTLATAHYTCPDNAIGLVAKCELSGYVWAIAIGGNFHTDLASLPVGVVRWPLVGDTAGYRLRRPKLTPFSSISMVFIGTDALSVSVTSRCCVKTVGRIGLVFDWFYRRTFVRHGSLLILRRPRHLRCLSFS